MGLYDFEDSEEDNEWNPRKMALSLGLFDNEEEQNDPQRLGAALGLTNSELAHQGKMPQQENYLDDNLGSVTRDLPIDQPNGSVVSGGREDLYHKYSQMLAEEPKSEGILQDFLGRRPTSDKFRNTGLERATAAVMGGVTGLNKGGQAGLETGTEWSQKPYERAQNEWKQEGGFIDDQMRLADSSKNREAAGILNLIRQQETERVNRNREKDRQTGFGLTKQANTDRASKAAADDENRDLDRKGREENQRGMMEDRRLNREDRNTRHEESMNLRRELKSLGMKPPSTMEGRTDSDVKSALRDKINTDSSVRALFDLESGQPKWIAEDREPTPLELKKYHEAMRSVEQGSLPSIESLGFGK